MLATQDTITMDSQKAQQNLGKPINRGRHSAHTAYLGQLPKPAHTPEPDDARQGKETMVFAKARNRRLQRLDATACLRARSMTSLRIFHTGEFVGVRRS